MVSTYHFSVLLPSSQALSAEVYSGDVPSSLPSAALVSGCTLGPSGASPTGGSGRTFVLLEFVGGERVGYLRAVFAEESLDAVFAVEAALEAEEPIMRACVPQLIKGECRKEV
jgi:hypothetical protein